MEEKEKYKVMSPSLNGYAYIHDFKTDNVLNTYDSCDLLNQQDKENQQLKQQLHDLPKKIVEEIRDVAGDYWDFNICEECGNVPDLNILTTKDFNEILDALLEKYGGEDE